MKCKTYLLSGFYNRSKRLTIHLLVALLFFSCGTENSSNKPEILTAVFGKLQPFIHTDTLSNVSYFKVNQGKGELKLNDVKWQCSVNFKEVEGNEKAMDAEIRIFPNENINSELEKGIELSFDKWSKENYVFIPASVYNGNRFKVVQMNWPTVVVDEADRYHDISPRIAHYVPHLNIDEGPSKLTRKLNDASTPAIGFYSPELQKSFLILIKPTRNFNIEIRENNDRSRASIILSANGQPDVFNNKQSDAFSINFRMFEFNAKAPIDLLTSYFQVRKSMLDPNEFVPAVPFSKMFEIQEALHNSERWNDKMQCYIQSGNHETGKWYSGVQLGWIGGLMEQQILLTAGNKLSQERSILTMENILNNMQGESGLMYGMYKDGKLYSDDYRNPYKEPFIGLTRKNGDALYFLLQELMLLKKNGTYKNSLTAFEPKAQKLADGLVKLWEQYGQFGQYVEPETGTLVVYGSTSGASSISALALASEYFNQNKYLKTAEAAAEFYYNRDLKNGYTTGGPGEAMQCPDSESAFALLEGFMALYDLTGNKKYLMMAEHAAAYFATYTTSYDFPFPENSPMGIINAKATGSVWANAQNKHGAPVICNYSGDALLKLYRATNNPLYLELLKDITYNSMQYVSTEEKLLAPHFKPGYVCERVNISNWEGENNVGGNLYDTSPWVEVALMQITVQVPSIYIDTEEPSLTVFDNLEANIEKVDKEGVSIRVKNPTEYNAICTVLMDSDKNKAMGWNNYADFEKVELEANEEKVVTFKIKI
ncbi:glycoside hydrolase family protein [Flammeovirga aprica]|uniref:Uncharacterized protein n=1 Tax=Flammeovirga aprica JL-4 TaxID=694437 RepID=A0A7X9XD16_9BACT|nr:hypothetical protein [Flammeovirga aprica]NME72431.1 hypothetical protein [Flammeovirga aprica JL-4]